MFEGSCVALVTPMTSNGEVDENTLIDLVDWHISEGTQAIVAVGSTGESATLSAEEQVRVISFVVKAAKGRIPILAGTGTSSTAATYAKTQAAKELGVDGCLIVTPYFNRPTQEGLIQHYRQVATMVDIPIVLYNVPSRTACDLQPTTVAELSEIPNIIGIKDATGDIGRLAIMKANCRDNFAFYSGDDPTALDFMIAGGKGVISITANVVPQLMRTMCQYALERNHEHAKMLNDVLQPLHHLMIIEANPIPVKWALYYLGKIANGIRLPLTTLSLEHQDKMIEALHIAKRH